MGARGMNPLGVLADTGEFTLGGVNTAGRATLLFFAALWRFPGLFRWREFRKVVAQLFWCCVCALPVVTITAMFSGMVIAGQTGVELGKFGLLDRLGTVVGITLCRELGPVLTAVVVAGFVGGGMAATVASMRVNEEIDALEVMSINPVRYLVLPRLAAMMLALPLLTVYADVVGTAGGMLVSQYTLGLPPRDFYEQAWKSLELADVYFGLFKAHVFGVIITLIACDQGFVTTGGAEGVGRATMRAVVYSFLMILVANYLLFSLIWRPFLA